MKKAISLLLASTMLTGMLAACDTKDPKPEVTTTVKQDENNGPTINNNVLDSSPVEEISYYQNPLLTAQTKDAWPGYGFGDPFVMRYNGTYYLYVSSKDGNTGIKCWSSDDLVNWKYENYCTRDRITTGAYAPEVYYYNGYFYMYTSPAGNGHYVLRSKSPTGPFETITDNMGMSIDGSIFIDNNGKWYFYTAGGGAIRYYNMTSPSQMTGGGALDNVSVNGGWTEGSMVVYHDGYYYITYTGNHVLAKSYRIYYNASKRSPIAFSNSAENPLLINTSDEMFGIGHSSTVKGPDLDSYYIVYHTLTSQHGPNRNMCIDRIVFNGESMEIMGPTTTKQQVPDQPDVYAHFRAGETLEGWALNGAMDSIGSFSLTAGSTLLSNHRFSGNYTAEYNVAKIVNGGKAGAIFSYTDENNYGKFLFDPASQKVIITITVDGKATVKEVKMIQSFKEDVKFDCIQSIQIEKKDKTYTFYMNDRELCSIKDSALPSGAIGYITEGASAAFGFIGGTAAVGGQGAADEYKSVSQTNGLIPATTYTIGQFATEVKNKKTTVVATEGNVLNYRILADEESYHDMSIEYFTGDDDKGAVVEIFVDGASIGQVNLPGSKSLATVIQGGIPLLKGQHTISVKLVSGSAKFSEFQILKNTAVDSLTVDFSKANDKPVYTDGTWRVQNGVLTMAGNPATGKRIWGDRNWSDYAVEVEVTPQKDVNCGVLVRVTNPGAPNFQLDAPTDNDAQTGTDWVEGYYIGLTNSNVILGKQSYNYKGLENAGGSFKTGTTYKVRVECRGANLKIYVDGKLYIDYTDADPFMQGMVGVRTHQSTASFDNLKVEALP
jgi:hypothetical protein